MSSEPRRTASTTLTAPTTKAARRAQPKLSTVNESATSPAIWRMSASAISTSRKPRTSVSGNRSAARTGGMTAFSTATIAATTSAPQKVSISTPGRSHEATIRATPVANHETSSGNNLRRGRSGCQDVAVRRLGVARRHVLLFRSLLRKHLRRFRRRGRRWNRPLRPDSSRSAFFSAFFSVVLCLLLCDLHLRVGVRLRDDAADQVTDAADS